MTEREWFTDEIESEEARLLADKSSHTGEGRRVFEIERDGSSYLVEEEKFELEDTGQVAQYTSLRAYEIPLGREMDENLSEDVGLETPVELKAAQVYRGDRLNLARDLRDEMNVDFSDNFDYGTAVSLLNGYGQEEEETGLDDSMEEDESDSLFHEPKLD